MSSRETISGLMNCQSGHLIEESTNLHSTSSESLNIHFDAFRSSTSKTFVIKRTPLLPSQKDDAPLLALCSANVQAIKFKTADLKHYVLQTDMDIFAYTETWLRDKDTAVKLEFFLRILISFFIMAELAVGGVVQDCW